MMFMDQKISISAVDAALADSIWNSIESDPAAKSIISSKEQISISSPKAIGHGTKKLSIFLYNIAENTTQKSMQTVTGNSEKSQDQTFLALSYLITSLTGNEQNDHLMLEKIITIFSATPVITNKKNNSELSVKMHFLPLDASIKLWIAIGASLKPSVALTVSTAQPLSSSHDQITRTRSEPEKIVGETNPVWPLYQTVLQTFTAQSNDWSNRNMLIKQWVFQDFKKNSSINVDEMQGALKDLGDALKENKSTAPFIKFLNLLSGYYTHQLKELEGAQKVTHRQTENIQEIKGWKKDVETLVNALSAKAE